MKKTFLLVFMSVFLISHGLAMEDMRLLRFPDINKELIAFSDLGPEAIFKLTVENFPLFVGVDSAGRSLRHGAL